MIVTCFQASYNNFIILPGHSFTFFKFFFFQNMNLNYTKDDFFIYYENLVFIFHLIGKKKMFKINCIYINTKLLFLIIKIIHKETLKTQFDLNLNDNYRPNFYQFA